MDLASSSVELLWVGQGTLAQWWMTSLRPCLGICMHEGRVSTLVILLWKVPSFTLFSSKITLFFQKLNSLLQKLPSFLQKLPSFKNYPLFFKNCPLLFKNYPLLKITLFSSKIILFSSKKKTTVCSILVTFILIYIYIYIFNDAV